MMLATIDPWILTFSAVTVIATIWMGFAAARKSKTTSDFFVAGRSVSVGWNASAISGEYLSAASFMGVAGMVMSVGYDALWYPVCYACGYLFLLLFIAGPLRRFGAYTVPDLAEGRFDSPVFRKIAVVFVLFIGFFYTMPQMKGAGTTLAYIFPGLPYWVGVAVVGAIITLNVALGGMKGITLVQAVQYWAKMFAISVPIFVLMAVYGNYGHHLQVNGAGDFNPERAAEIRRQGVIDLSLDTNPAAFYRKSLPEKAPKDETWLSPFGPLTTKAAKAAKPKMTYLGDCESNDYSIHSRQLKWMPFQAKTKFKEYGFRQNEEYEVHQFVIAYGSDITGFEHFTTRSSYKVMVASELAHKSLVWPQTNNFTPKELPAAIESFLSKNGITLVREPGNVFKAFPTKDAVITPINPKPYSLLYTYSLIMALVCGTAGLPHILVRFYTNPDGVAAKRTTMWVMILIGVFYVFPPVFGVMGRNLLPELYNGIGAKGTDKIVLELPRLLNEKYAPLGSILSGVTCAGAFAAFMSTFSGLLVSMTGAMAHDVYGRMLNPKATAEQRLRAFKIAAVIVGGIAILLGTQVETLEINFMVGQAFAIAAASYFPFLFMCAWWRKLTMKGAATGMLTGGLLALMGITLTSISDIALKTSKANGTPNPLRGMQDFWAGHPGIRIISEQPAIWAVPLAIILMIIVSKLTAKEIPADIQKKMLVLHAPEKLGLKQEYIQEHQAGH